jgi:hypothetical protein
MPNPFGKSRKIDNPHAIYVARDFEFRILKTYKLAKSEDKDPYARWFVAAKSDNTFGSFEMGDTYRRDIANFARLVAATPEWLEAYRPGWTMEFPTPTEYIAKQEA